VLPPTFTPLALLVLPLFLLLLLLLLLIRGVYWVRRSKRAAIE